MASYTPGTLDYELDWIGHERECALAAIALRIEAAEKARDRAEAKEWRKLYREIAE